MIRKFQQGGPTFVDYTPYPEPTPVDFTGVGSGTTTPASKKASGELTEKDLLGMIKDIDGLPSDMSGVINNIQRLLSAQQYGVGTSSLKTTYLKALQQVKTATFYKKQWEDAYKNVVANKGISEYAIDERGRVIAFNKKGEIKPITIDEFRKNSSNYQLLTNEELLNLRAHSQQYSGNQEMLSVIENGIGMEKVNSLIKAATASLGSIENSSDGYVKREQESITKGLEFLQNNDISSALQSGISEDGLYKAGITNKDSAKQIMQSLQYVYSVLPENAKTLLKLKSDGSEKGALSIIGSLISSTSSETHKFDLTQVKDKNGSNTGSGSGSGSEPKQELTPALAFVLGMGERSIIEFNTGTSYSVKALARESILTDSSGNPLGSGKSLQDVANGSFAASLDFNSATFGGQRINPGLYNHFILNNAQIVGVDLPIDLEAKQQGLIKPDFSLTKKMENAEFEISTNNITDPKEQNEIYKKYDLPEKYIGDKLNTQAYARFGAIQGMADESLCGSSVSLDETVSEVTGDEQRNNFVLSVNQASNTTDSKNKDKFKLSDGTFGWGRDDLYSGTLFIPVKESTIGATLGQKQYYKFSSGNDPLYQQAKYEQDHPLDLDENQQKLNSYQAAPNLSSLK